jgi:superfamily II DNA or RNA helicase
MLALIREKLTQLGVKFEYFDGSTTAIERERAIQNFQKNDEVRVFLISLKAGGVGLNLTAADYVYIVDQRTALNGSVVYITDNVMTIQNENGYNNSILIL